MREGVREESGVIKKMRGTKARQMVIILTRRFLDRDDDLYYIDAPHFNIIRAAVTPVEAEEVFQEAIGILFGGWNDKDVFHRRLQELGFTILKVEDVVIYCPPEVELSQEPTRRGDTRFENLVVHTQPYDNTTCAVGAG